MDSEVQIKNFSRGVESIVLTQVPHAQISAILWMWKLHTTFSSSLHYVRGPINIVNAAPISSESRGTPLTGWILILSKMYRGIMHTQLKRTAVLQTKILPETWFDPQGTRNHKTGSNQLQYKHTARIRKTEQQSFREHCVSMAGTRVLSDTLHIKKEVKYLEKSLASIVFHLNTTKKLGILLLISAHQIFTERGRWASWG